MNGEELGSRKPHKNLHLSSTNVVCQMLFVFGTSVLRKNRLPLGIGP